ncbi:MAG: 4-alpha-glucanotransferase [Lautropia sp.]|nr:4-alpha-glucanotransferase [Lautropia sp.]
MSPDLSRASGILLHVTSLPDPQPAQPGQRLNIHQPGSGDFGPTAFHFIDWLEHTAQHLWQVLPLVPTGKGYSPYMSPASMAFNPMLVDLRALADAGWLPHDFCERDEDIPVDHRGSPGEQVDFPRVERFRLGALRLAARTFLQGTDDPRRPDFEAFCQQEKDWLDDYALFMVLNERFDDLAWQEWPADLAQRKPKALAQIRKEARDDYLFWCFVQWNAGRQWQAVRQHAQARGVRIVGDLPIFIALNSADCWANPQLFDLGEDLWPTAVAGVPPDYFAADGQLWGNPLYRWPAHARENYAWWTRRMQRSLVMADAVRVDHFRGFAAYWSVPAGAATAREGQWQPGPGRALFDAIAKAMGPLPLIAEDLGTLGPEVGELMAHTGLPGMAVLQFAFASDATNPYLPHNLITNKVVYTGTHDNDTTLGWFHSTNERERARAQIYLKTDGREMNWELIHTASQSVANWAIYPMQDVLGLGSEARMNRPGDQQNCWGWRFAWQQLHEWQTRRLRAITQVHGRDEPAWSASR